MISRDDYTRTIDSIDAVIPITRVQRVDVIDIDAQYPHPVVYLV